MLHTPPSSRSYCCRRLPFLPATMPEPTPDLSLLGDDYHGVHPAAVQPGYKRVAWQKCDQRTVRVRVRDYTCDCQPIVYELCQVGRRLDVRPALLPLRRRARTSKRVAARLCGGTAVVTHSAWAGSMNSQPGPCLPILGEQAVVVGVQVRQFANSPIRRSHVQGVGFCL